MSVVKPYERSHLSDRTLLRNPATHLARERADAAVTLAERFPRPDLMSWVAALPGPTIPAGEHAPAHVEQPPAFATVPGGDGP